jgi:hypothetical protein
MILSRDVDISDGAFAVLCVAVPIAVGESRADLSQIAHPDWLTAQDTKGMSWAPPDAKQNSGQSDVAGAKSSRFRGAGGRCADAVNRFSIGPAAEFVGASTAQTAPDVGMASLASPTLLTPSKCGERAFCDFICSPRWCGRMQREDSHLVGADSPNRRFI